MKTLRSTMLTSALVLSLAGCDDPPKPARPVATPAPQASAPVAAEAPAAAAAAPAYVYNYSPVGKRDPFRSPLEELGRTKQQTQVSVCTEPLCQWDLDQLKLVAVVTGDANPLAMVEDPMGRGHIVRRNAKMGRQGGKVTQILRDSVTVTEYLPGGSDGKVISNPVSLQLRPDDARAPVYNMMTGKDWE
ncbi:pilus assembly protein PilP [Myxococcaceae bacterium GXIMD 01537]